MYLSRSIEPAFRRAMASFPSILLTGPRQSGKTTFLKHLSGGRAGYATFDDPFERSFAASDPHGFLDRFSGTVILDEIQYVPDLLPFLKMRIDEGRTPGRFLLTGSQQFHLMRNVSESLAGRVAIFNLPPFSAGELGRRASSLDDFAWTGGFPDPALHPDRRDLWMASYLQTYVERDVRQLAAIQNLPAFESFVALSAARHAQPFNAAEMGRDCGVSLPTAKTWAGLLVASHLAFLLPPWHRNYGKRIVKTPKFYLLDSGLASYLTRQPSPGAILSGGMGGAIFEGMMVAEGVKAFAAAGRRPDLWFWRSHDGIEVDLIVPAGGKLHPVEIKLTATPTLGHIAPLDTFRRLAGDDAAPGVLVCRIKERKKLPNGNLALPWHEFPDWLAKKVGYYTSSAVTTTPQSTPRASKWRMPHRTFSASSLRSFRKSRVAFVSRTR